MMEQYTLHCGDCLRVMPTLGRIDAVVTDPPYGIEYQSNRGAYHGDKRKTGNTFGKDIYDPKWMPEIAKAMKPRSLAYVFVRWDTAHLFKRDAEEGGLVCVQRLIWDKCHWGMGDLEYYGSQTEDCLLFRKGAPHLNWAKRMGNIFAYPSKAYFPEGVFDHPAQKPLGVIQAWVEHATSPGDIVLDPFMGSGTTGVACMQTGRRFIGIELDENYFKIAERRIADAARQARGEFRTIQDASSHDDLPLFAST